MITLAYILKKFKDGEASEWDVAEEIERLIERMIKKHKE